MWRTGGVRARYCERMVPQMILFYHFHFYLISLFDNLIIPLFIIYHPCNISYVEVSLQGIYC